ncbi:MAG: hemerythrin family protein [Spirochaetales bacterium]|nr:hemerythrin family protein [Spirochaetales bacterium]
MFIIWIDDKHSIGIPEIDEQHKQLFILTNQIYDESQKEVKDRNLIPVLKRIYSYTNYHFSSEEGMFKKYGYAKYLSHISKHREFTQRLKVYLQDYRDKPNYTLDEPLDFMVDWIVTHIQGEDRVYADYFKAQGINPSIHFNSSDKSTKESITEALSIWEKKKLQIENYTLDHQHKELVYIMQQIKDLQKASSDRARMFLPSIIQKLFYYSQYHFSYEEELMAKHNFENILEHRELHQGFILRIQDFAREYNLEKETLNTEMLQFLKEWVLTHILDEDMKYKELLKD